MKKKCKNCGEFKLFSEFYKSIKSKDGLQSYCKECSRKHSKKFHSKNPEYNRNYRLDHTEYFEDIYDTNMEKSIEYLGGTCFMCGCTNKPWEIHHIVPRDQDKPTIASLLTCKWDVIKLELDRCVLLCRSCHKSLHVKIREIIKLEMEINNENNVHVG